jgi:hypothetical protein
MVITQQLISHTSSVASQALQLFQRVAQLVLCPQWVDLPIHKKVLE